MSLAPISGMKQERTRRFISECHCFLLPVEQGEAVTSLVSLFLSESIHMQMVHQSEAKRNNITFQIEGHRGDFVPAQSNEQRSESVNQHELQISETRG